MRLTRDEQDSRILKVLIVISVGATSKDILDRFDWPASDMTKFFKRLDAHGVKITKTKVKKDRYNFYKLNTPIQTAIELLGINPTGKEKKSDPYKVHRNSGKMPTKLSHSEKPWFIICK